jgi:hypothetical protein
MTKWLESCFPGTTDVRQLKDMRLLMGAKTQKIAETAINGATQIYNVSKGISHNVVVVSLFSMH